MSEQLLNVPLVALEVGIDFSAPEFNPRAGPSEDAAFMAVPEAAVNEEHGFVFGKDEVRLAWKFSVKPVAKAARMQQFPQDQLWLCILAANAGHHPASCFG
ncbi:hypothetical protein BF49_0786 [Bradyrhizobium sp.]|nr:hypothetical protein BF49_0786 [Bradyrhizobium sp.]